MDRMLLELILAVPAFIIGVVSLVWLPRGRKVAGIAPRCAACGYIVHGLPAPMCPECGSDLAKPGAIVTTGRLPPARLARSIGWSIFCLLAVLMPVNTMWQAFVMPAIPVVHDSSRSVTLLSPESNSYRSINLSSHTHALVYRNQPGPLPAELKFELTRSDGTNRALLIDAATLHFRDSSALGRAMSATPLDADALVLWLKSIGIQGTADQLNKEMSKAMTLVHQAVSGAAQSYSSGDGFAGVAGSSSGFTLSPLPWVGRAPLFAAAIVWCIGMIWVLRKMPKAGGDSHMASS